MNRRQLVVANVQYRKPTLEGSKQTKGLLRYYTYRDGRAGQVIQKPGLDRWVDRGLGQTMTAIAATCEQLKGEHVLAFTVVINPNPELVQMVPMAERTQFVHDLTETTLERFFEARDIETGVELSYVFHHRDSTNPQSPGLHNPHTHILLPGTYYDEGKGERVPLYFSRNKKVDHIDLLHRTAEGTMTDLLDRYVGLEWEQRLDALTMVRELQRRIVEDAPHFALTNAQRGGQDAWVGVRRTTEHQSAVGYYSYYPDSTESTEVEAAPKITLQFRPLLRGLSHHHAEAVAAIAAYQCLAQPEWNSDLVMDMVQQLGSVHPEHLEQHYYQLLPLAMAEANDQQVDYPRAVDIGF